MKRVSYVFFALKIRKMEDMTMSEAIENADKGLKDLVRHVEIQNDEV